MSQPHATSATQVKDRQYAHLSASLIRLSHSIGQTADLFAALQVDLDAMRLLAGWHASQFMSVGAATTEEIIQAAEDKEDKDSE
ncbi:hypothetical protein NEOLEDRAFT_1130236 [Neolentinus lepideus HHB14362 ss-1]|uniref:Uncharacterized protein n=1 Tax=Neolentinus lepideus HHB14362 ss-1 TaxID=1314782 RepID=A0A165U7T7_9AGAM|nr:hypothetical protein NEOLEDRAFT_1130236 [Neolentinus lepideus HHB14362 ss-1]